MDVTVIKLRHPFFFLLKTTMNNNRSAIYNMTVKITAEIVTWLIISVLLFVTLFCWYRMFDSIDPLVSFLWLIPSLPLAAVSFLAMRNVIRFYKK